MSANLKLYAVGLYEKDPPQHRVGLRYLVRVLAPRKRDARARWKNDPVFGFSWAELVRVDPAAGSMR